MIDAFREALAVTLFVFFMMLVIDYANVLWRGDWQRRLAAGRWGQYLLAGALGVVPGCLGAFTVVSMYSHGTLTLGAVVAGMVATSGDEAFVLLALVPGQAVLLAAVLFPIGIAAGALTDAFAGGARRKKSCADGGFLLHAPHTESGLPSWSQVRDQWRRCIPARGLVAGGLVLLLASVVLGLIGPREWDWLRCTLAGVALLALLIVAVAPDHFIEEHLWLHLVRQHVPSLFLWTFGALALMALFSDPIARAASSQTGRWAMLTAACLVGLVPESGPHLVFVTLFAKGSLPFSVLLANSIVQDGHGMLPMLAHSRRDFLKVKAINLAVGFIAGVLAMAAGY
ncbi:MAG: putative manganese transporter [Elusimicrobiota bacterium]